MGIIVLSLAILPLLGVGGMQLFQAEVPGPTADRLQPRIQDTAKALWGAYVLLTAAETVLLLFGGMDLHEALCHAFATMATGGFSTEGASLGAWGAFVQWVVTLFMFLAGVNFALHFAAIFKRKPVSYLRSEELRFFASVVLVSTLVLTALNAGGELPLSDALRHSAFTVVSIVTTTGFATEDYEAWHVLSQYVLIALMFLGGMAGSTGGGMKVVRCLLVVKHGWLQLVRLIHPREVKLLKLDGQVVERGVIRSILGFVVLYTVVLLAGSFAMAACGLDLVTAGSSALACLSNIGPGVGHVGPMDNYAFIPGSGKLVLCLLMLLGRLEIFTVLVLILPSFWRK
jgi:trk system potassium uptake protein TrkH